MLDATDLQATGLATNGAALRERALTPMRELGIERRAETTAHRPNASIAVRGVPSGTVLSTTTAPELARDLRARRGVDADSGEGKAFGGERGQGEPTAGVGRA